MAKHNQDLAKYPTHHYFTARGIRLLKKDGMLVFVITSYFMDNKREHPRDHVRDVIEKEGGNLLMAYRLPEDVFSDAKVTTDIVFITKNQTGVRWQKTKKIEVKKQMHEINEYFVNHPENILGKLDVTQVYNKPRTVCINNGDLQSKLENKIKLLPKNYKKQLILQNYLHNKLKEQLLNIIQKINKRKICYDVDVYGISFDKIDIKYIDYDYKQYEKGVVKKLAISDNNHYWEISIKLNYKDYIYSNMLKVEHEISKYIRSLLKDKIKYQVYFDFKSLKDKS